MGALVGSRAVGSSGGEHVHLMARGGQAADEGAAVILHAANALRGYRHDADPHQQLQAGARAGPGDRVMRRSPNVLTFGPGAGWGFT